MNSIQKIIGIGVCTILVALVLRMPLPAEHDNVATLIRFLTPPAGETYAFGDRMDIRWKGGLPESPVSIGIVNERGDQLYRTLLPATSNDGEESWYVDMPPGQYALAISSERTPVFTVTEGLSTQLLPEAEDTPANQSLTLFYPQGGEILHAGTVETIRWYGGTADQELSLKLISASDFSLKEVIGTDIPHNHWYAWTVPSVIDDSKYYLVLEFTNCTPATRILTDYSITIKNP